MGVTGIDTSCGMRLDCTNVLQLMYVVILRFKIIRILPNTSWENSWTYISLDAQRFYPPTLMLTLTLTLTLT